MSSVRMMLRSARAAPRVVRPFSTTRTRFAERSNDTAEEHRKIQTEKPLNPHMTNTNSTIANEMPSIGKDAVPPEMITSIDPEFTPKDSVPENTERMTGGSQKGAPESGVNADLAVGEIEGGSFRVEPLRRTGEDANTTRARLLCSCDEIIEECDTLIARNCADVLCENYRPKQEARNARERSPSVHIR